MRPLHSTWAPLEDPGSYICVGMLEERLWKNLKPHRDFAVLNLNASKGITTNLKISQDCHLGRANYSPCEHLLHHRHFVLARECHDDCILCRHGDAVMSSIRPRQRLARPYLSRRATRRG